MDWPLQNVNLSPSFIENTLETLPKLKAHDNRGQAYRPYKLREGQKKILRLSDLQLKGKYHNMLNVVLDLQQNNGQDPRA
jgi:hypothetical protein